MNCKYCGCLLEDGDERKYCPECGKPLFEEPTLAEVEEDSEEVNEQEVVDSENSEELSNNDLDESQEVYERDTESDEANETEDKDSSFVDSNLSSLDFSYEESEKKQEEGKPEKANKGGVIIAAFAGILLVGCIVVVLAVSSIQKKKDKDNTSDPTSTATSDTNQAETQESVDSTGSDSELNGESIVDNGVVGDYSGYDQYVTSLGNYVGIEVNMTPAEVTDEDIENEINTNLMSATTTEEITDRNTVQEGDIANIDYTGYMDGEAFDGGSDTGYDLTIGSGSFIPGFEDGLIGATVGETTEVKVTFPEEYTSQPDYAGKEATFEVTVNSIKQEVTPELNDEWVANNSEYTNVADYKESIRTQLEETAAQQMIDTKADRVLEEIYNNSTIEGYPEGKMEEYLASMTSYYEYYASMFGATLEDFVSSYFGMTIDEFNTELQSLAEFNVGTEMICYRIAAEEGMTLTDEEYQTGAQEYATENGYETVEEFEAAYAKSQIYNRIIIDRVMEYVANNAIEVTE